MPASALQAQARNATDTIRERWAGASDHRLVGEQWCCATQSRLPRSTFPFKPPCPPAQKQLLRLVRQRAGQFENPSGTASATPSSVKALTATAQRTVFSVLLCCGPWLYNLVALPTVSIDPPWPDGRCA